MKIVNLTSRPIMGIAAGPDNPNIISPDRSIPQVLIFEL
jgi:hypothetical protein